MRIARLFVLALVPVLAVGRATADDATCKKPAAAVPAGGAAAEKPEQSDEEALAELQKKILEGLADPKPAARVAAADAIVLTWPDSTLILDAALTSARADVRFEATCLLRRPELGDVRDRIRPRIADSDARVRMHAVRAARSLKWPEIEPDFIRIVNGDASWLVIQETLRGLEDVGSAACLQSVFRGWTRESNPDRRPRFKRVLVKILKNDFVDDLDKWRAAIEQAESAARAAKASKPAKPAASEQPAKPEQPAAPDKPADGR